MSVTGRLHRSYYGKMKLLALDLSFTTFYVLRPAAGLVSTITIRLPMCGVVQALALKVKPVLLPIASLIRSFLLQLA